MKFLFIALALITATSWAQTEKQRREILRERMESEVGVFNPKEVGLCRYQLLGPKIPVKTVFEAEDMNFEKCESITRNILDQNKLGFTRALLKHSSKENWVTIKKKKQ